MLEQSAQRRNLETQARPIQGKDYPVFSLSSFSTPWTLTSLSIQLTAVQNEALGTLLLWSWWPFLCPCLGSTKTPKFQALGFLKIVCK